MPAGDLLIGTRQLLVMEAPIAKLFQSLAPKDSACTFQFLQPRLSITTQSVPPSQVGLEIVLVAIMRMVIQQQINQTAVAIARLLVLVIAIAVLTIPPSHAQQSPAGPAAGNAVPIYVFWQEGCPYCRQARDELAAMQGESPLLRIKELEVGVSGDTDALYAAVLEYFGFGQAGVPLVVIGNEVFLGFASDGSSAAAYRQAASQCLSDACPDVVSRLAAGRGLPAETTKAETDPATRLHRTIDLPFIGPVQTSNLSLPALTILLAAIDGFNPCAMWVLVFLIGLLLGLNDERRMWILGISFLLATAIMYFTVMAAWLNLVLLVGAVGWVRLVIGVLAVGGGLYFLREYWTKPEAVCAVTSPGRRQRIMDALRKVVQQNQLVWAIPGIMLLAVAVNMVELLCSAGIPAVYTQILAMNELSAGAHYFYLALYTVVFLLDDLVIFATAMIALRVTGLTGRYARFSHLIGGIVLLAIGAALILRPDLLTFG
jgi:hypothetical protein